MAVHCTNYIETYKCTVWEKYGAFVLNLWVQILTTTTEKVNEGRRRVLKCLLWCMWVSHKGQHVCVTMNRMCVSHKEQQVCESQRTASVWVTKSQNELYVSHNEQVCERNEQHVCESQRAACVWVTKNSKCVSHKNSQRTVCESQRISVWAQQAACVWVTANSVWVCEAQRAACVWVTTNSNIPSRTRRAICISLSSTARLSLLQKRYVDLQRQWQKIMKSQPCTAVDESKTQKQWRTTLSAANLTKCTSDGTFVTVSIS